MTDAPRDPNGMSPYEQARWSELQTHWEVNAAKRQLLHPRARAALSKTGEAAKNTAATAGGAIGDATPQAVKNFVGSAVDASLASTVHHVVELLDLLNDRIVDLNNPNAVIEYHRDQGRGVTSLRELRSLELEHLEAFTSGMALRARTVGLGQGASFGALAMIPVPGLGSAAAITLDLIAMQALTTAIATRVCFSYGFDAAEPAVRPIVERMVSRGYREQVIKAQSVQKAGAAFNASKGRINWSDKLRKDHRLMDGVERLLKQVGNGQRVPVRNARMGMPVVAVLAGAATNSRALGDTAKQARHYGATLLLAEKYGLDLPANLLDDLAPAVASVTATEGAEHASRCDGCALLRGVAAVGRGPEGAHALAGAVLRAVRAAELLALVDLVVVQFVQRRGHVMHRIAHRARVGHAERHVRDQHQRAEPDRDPRHLPQQEQDQQRERDADDDGGGG